MTQKKRDLTDTPVEQAAEDKVDQGATGGAIGGGVSATTPTGGVVGRRFDQDQLAGVGDERGVIGGVATGDVVRETPPGTTPTSDTLGGEQTLGHDTVGVTPTGDVDGGAATGDLAGGTPTGEEGDLPIVEDVSSSRTARERR